MTMQLSRVLKGASLNLKAGPRVYYSMACVRTCKIYHRQRKVEDVREWWRKNNLPLLFINLPVL